MYVCMCGCVCMCISECTNIGCTCIVTTNSNNTIHVLDNTIQVAYTFCVHCIVYGMYCIVPRYNIVYIYFRMNTIGALLTVNKIR